jgi:cytochrome c553
LIRQSARQPARLVFRDGTAKRSRLFRKCEIVNVQMRISRIRRGLSSGVRRGGGGAQLAAAIVLLASIVAARGQTIEDKAAICGTCHGKAGIPQEKTTPVIWGQQEGYLYLQLRDFKRGARKNEKMAPIVATLEREDMLALAAYFAHKAWPSLEQPSASAEVAKRALTAIGSVGCTGCHLGEFQGDGSVPRLAGQSREYLAKTIAEFRTRERANNPGMSDLMSATSQDELAAVEAFLAGR